MNVAIIGYGVEGRASAAYFAARGHTVTVCDKQADTVVDTELQSQLGDDYLADLDRFDVIVRSAGIRPAVILEKNPTVEPIITTAVNEFLAHSPTRQIIGVTGTKGKGTTSTLITNMLEAAGHKVWLGGNIGRSPLAFIDQVTEDDWVVLELSSFQLSDIHRSPPIAVCLMVVPEHLDWHRDVAEYYAAKSHLFTQQKSDDVAIYYASNATSSQIASTSPGQKIPFGQAPGAFVNAASDIEIDGATICSTNDLKLLGKHNWQNACAAVTAVWYSGCHDRQAMHTVLTTFTGLPHRLEKVREFNGVRYYDDSFGTTPETAIVALQAFQEPKVIILGGASKGVDYQELATAVAHNNVRHAIVIGDTAPQITKYLREVGFDDITLGLTRMSDIVAQAQTSAQPGDVVLLSTGCASFGLFKNYKDRGEQFSQAVRALS